MLYVWFGFILLKATGHLVLLSASSYIECSFYHFFPSCVPTSPVWISQVMSWQNLNFHFMEATSHLTSSSRYRYIHLLMNEWHFKPYYFLYCLLAVKYSTFQMHMFYMPIFFFLNKAAPLGNGLSSGHLMFSFLIFTYARQSCSIHRTTLLHTTMV